MNEMQRNRNVDILKGIAILSVIIGHTWCPLPYMRAYIYSFHMPVFFIIAGYFFNIEKYSIKKDLNRLMIPYAVFATADILLSGLESLYISDMTRFQHSIIAAFWGSSSIRNPGIWGQIPNIGTIWFLLVLFEIRYLLFVLLKHFNDKIIVSLSIIFFILSAFLRNFISFPFSLLTTLGALNFVVLGYMLKNIELR